MSFTAIRNALQAGIYQVINPFVRLLIKAGATPNGVTLTGLVLNMGVAVLFIVGGEEGHRGDLRYVGWAGALILFAGLFDMLDGQVARLGNLKSEYGALFDSVIDRYSELFTFLGICYYLVAHHYLLGSLFAFIALIGSMMVSYTRARAEGLGVVCQGGLMQRPERVVLLGVSALACGISSAYLGGDYKVFMPGVPFHVFETMSIFTWPITVLAVLSNITAVSRLRQARQALAHKATSATTSKLAATLLLLLGSLLLSQPQPTWAAPRQSPPMLKFPVPAGIPNQLFYLQRDPNTNTVIYQLNVNNAGQLDEEEPINVFWMRYDEQGQRKDLNYIQRRFAYGLSAKKVAANKYVLKFSAYNKIPLFLLRTAADNAFHVVAVLHNQQIVLTRVYLRIEGGSFWVPNVKYIELKGWNAATREAVTERLAV